MTHHTYKYRMAFFQLVYLRQLCEIIKRLIYIQKSCQNKHSHQYFNICLNWTLFGLSLIDPIFLSNFHEDLESFFFWLNRVGYFFASTTIYCILFLRLLKYQIFFNSVALILCKSFVPFLYCLKNIDNHPRFRSCIALKPIYVFCMIYF